MSGASVLSLATDMALLLLTAAFVLVLARLIRGPSLADRVLALDTTTTIAIGFVGVIAVKTGFDLYVDIAIAIALVGFLSTVAFARYLLSRRVGGEGGDR